MDLAAIWRQRAEAVPGVQLEAALGWAGVASGAQGKD